MHSGNALPLPQRYGKKRRPPRNRNKYNYMRSYIKISGDLRALLRDNFKVTNKTIWQACAGLSDSELSRKIRQYALNHGGRWVTEVAFAPSCNTKHLSDGSFIQEFANGVSVIFSNGRATILKNDNEVEIYEGVTLNVWGNVLSHAQAISEGNFETIISR